MQRPFNLFPSRKIRRFRAMQPAPKRFILQTRDGNFVSVIKFWRRNLGIGLGANGRGIHWLAGISILCYIITTISQIIALTRVKGDAAKMFEFFSVTSFCAMGLLKLYSLRGSQERWFSMLSRASKLEEQQLKSQDLLNVDYESEGEEDNIFQTHIATYTRKFVSTSNMLTRIYTPTCIIYILSPFIEYTIWKIQGADILEYPHILPVWTPLDKYFPAYLITIAAEGIAAVYCVFAHIAFDLSTVGVTIFIHGQFALLRESCERIGGQGRLLDLSLKRDLRAHFRISRCQRIHASVIKSVNDLRALTQNILGIYFNLATLTLCSVAVQVSTIELSNTQLFTLLQYMSALLTQLFLYCFYGDAVINESSIGLGEGPSASAWWCLSPRIRREIGLLCVSMSRRCRLLAGPFYFVNLPAFIQIVRTAYSYFAVIRQRYNN